MPHIERKPGDMIYMRGLWFRDLDDYMDTLTEYAADERAARLDDREDDE